MLTAQTRFPPFRSNTPETAPRGDVSQVRAILKRGLISVTKRQVPNVARLLDGSLPVNRVPRDARFQALQLLGAWHQLLAIAREFEAV